MKPRVLDFGSAPRGSSVLITGGCGFVGTNLAHRLLSEGHRVCVYDNLSRPGVTRNLAWLRENHGERLIVRIEDTRDSAALRDAVREASLVFHLAAQVAVTTSLENPVADFEINAGAAINLLEAIRATSHRPPLFYASTNKVYGGLDDLELDQNELRYMPRTPSLAHHGLSEERPLDFHSPYGCSKGAADQYVRDYARSYGLQTVVFRMSCIYGPHQFGTEDQGWVAHFLIQALNRKPLTIYGDGRQVRDILFVEDLVNAFLLAAGSIDSCSGQAFNIGGGTANAVSLLEILRLLKTLEGREPRVEWGDWRAGDQRYYVSDSSRFSRITGWWPDVGVEQGLRRLRDWLIAAGIPSLVRAAAEHPATLPRSAGSAGGGADVAIAAAPLRE
jgi:CDP-paratose 2-epimerase